MHRSGTSAFARVLNLLGCDLPQTVMQAHEAGETSSWQSDAVGQLNDRILASAGSRWADWLEFNPGWLESPRAEEFREEALALVREEFGSSRQFVLEDPRICRLLPFWLGVLQEAGAQPLIVSPVRNPLEVAASLEERDGFEAGLGHLLWLRHVLDAEFASRGTRRFFTSYDRLSTRWARTATDAESTLGIAWPRISDKAAVEIEAFLSDNNSHYQQPVDAALDNPTLSDWLRASFEILGRWSAEGENPEDFATLDRIRAAFNTAAPAFSRLLRAEEDKLSRLEKDLESQAGAAKAAEETLAETRSRLAAAEQAAAAEQEKAARLEKDLASRADAAQKAEQALVEAESKLAATEQAAAAEQEKAARVEAELARERQRLGETEQQILQLESKLESWTGAARAAEQELADTQAKLATAEQAAAAEQDKASHLELELSTERQRLAEAEQQASRLKAELESRTRAAAETETALVELRHRLAQTESALAQRRHEAEETAGALAATGEDLRRTAEARDEAEKVSAGLKDHVVLLMADLKERQAAFAAEQHTGAADSAAMARQVKQVLAVLETSRHEMASRLSQAERAMKQQAAEIETLKALVDERQGEAHHERETAEHLRQAAAGEVGRAVAGLLNGHGSPFWRPFRLRRQVALLKRSGLFDAEWYLREYTDVAKAGIDPMRHYIEHGAKEGRAPNPALTKLNGKT
jgi:hypothetical protein